MADSTPFSRLRKQILDRKQIALQPHTRKPVPLADLPDEYPKSPKMKYLEVKYHCKIEVIIYNRSLSDVVAYFKGEVDRSTVSRWRKHISIHLGLVYADRELGG